MRKPNAVIHMALWGTAGGLTTALFYLLLIAIFGADFELWRIFVLASLYGGVPGAVLGVIDGMIVQATLDDKDNQDLNVKRMKAESKVGLTTFLGMLLFLGLAISPMLFIYIYVSFIPPILAMITAVYATKRYFMRVAELNGLKAKIEPNKQQSQAIEHLALRVSEQRQALSTNFAKVQKSQHRRS